jgi:hypothetical protein
MKKLVAITHPDEWNQLLPFNSYINTIKNDYECVIAIVPYKGYIVLSEADEIVTTHDGDIFSYPAILEKNHRRNDEFLDKCVNFCINKYGIENIDIKSWQNTKYDEGIVNEISEPEIKYYQKSFFYAKKFLDYGLTIKPTKGVFNKIKHKYGKFFNGNTFIIMTRNFHNKATFHNTINTLPNLENTIKHLTESDLKIVNIGFPPQSYDIKNNYIEINEELTQDELISLFYLSKGVIMASDAGGFVTHFASDVDFYILTEEWSVSINEVNISLINAKKTNQTISLINLSDTEILERLKKYGKSQNKTFSKPKKIHFI